MAIPGRVAWSLSAKLRRPAFREQGCCRKLQMFLVPGLNETSYRLAHRMAMSNALLRTICWPVSLACNATIRNYEQEESCAWL